MILVDMLTVPGICTFAIAAHAVDWPDTLPVLMWHYYCHIVVVLIVLITLMPNAMHNTNRFKQLSSHPGGLRAYQRWTDEQKTHLARAEGALQRQRAHMVSKSHNFVR